MRLRGSEDARRSLRRLFDLGLIGESDIEAALALDGEDSIFLESVRLAESTHLHIRVADTTALPREALLAGGASLDRELSGFVKFRLPGGVNAIFSESVSSESAQTSSGAEPYLDHIGLDIREETDRSRGVFSAIADQANKEGIPVVAQGEDGSGVACCHVEVSEKRWLFPNEGSRYGGKPIEVVYGSLKLNDSEYGSDLRPLGPAGDAEAESEDGSRCRAAPSCCD